MAWLAKLGTALLANAAKRGIQSPGSPNWAVGGVRGETTVGHILPPLHLSGLPFQFLVDLKEVLNGRSTKASTSIGSSSSAIAVVPSSLLLFGRTSGTPERCRCCDTENHEL